MSSTEEMYQPQVDALLKILPPLYAFRMTALKLGGVSLAQGSPSEGPPAHMIMDRAMAMLDWAVKQPSASAIDPQKISLAVQFLDAQGALTNEQKPTIELTGYPDVRLYQATQQAAMDFLGSGFEMPQSHANFPARHIVIDSYARHLLNMSLRVLRKTDENLTVKQNREHNIVITYNGHWPLVTDVVAANDYTLLHVQPTDITAFKFADFKTAIIEMPPDSNVVVYVNNPNNPLSVMYAQQQQADFLLETAKFNRLQQEGDIGRRVRILSDNAYWGWVKPEYIQENGFPFFTKAAAAVAAKTNLPVHDWLIECFSLGKVFGLASIGASFAFVGDADLQAKIVKEQTRDTNTPGADKLEIIMQTLKTVDMDHLLHRAATINQNLIWTRDALNAAAQETHLPISLSAAPEHGAYISVQLGTEFLNRRVFIQRKPYDVKNVLEVCKFLVEKHGVAITPNDQTDLPGTVRIFVDAPQDKLRDGVRRITSGLKELLDAGRVPNTVPLIASSYDA